jgi:hypothetical protein
MNLRKRMDDMRANWPSLLDADPEEHIGWLAEQYREILADCGAGLTMTLDQCKTLARAGTAPTDEQLLPIALHAEFLERIQAGASLRA